MLQTARATTTIRRTVRPSVVPLGIVTALIIATLVYQSASSGAPSFGGETWPGAKPAAPPSASASPPSFSDVPPRDQAITEDDGVLPDGVTVLDDEYPGVRNLDPDLLGALRDAATRAADDGIELDLNSGWRSPDFQEQLLRDAVSAYGSEAEAARWVATAETSPHVTGDAVDIGSADATTWLAKHGARYGLCQTYRNEPWHFELYPDAIGRRCPRSYADPTEDPRMHQ